MINACLAEASLPRELAEAKLVPLYKGKGCDQDGYSCRALTIMHPLAKLIMGVLTQRLDTISET